VYGRTRVSPSMDSPEWTVHSRSASMHSGKYILAVEEA
jgi:hypothetical protein